MKREEIELGIHRTMCFLKNLTDSQSIADQMLKQLINSKHHTTELYHHIKRISVILDDIENRLSPSLTLGELTTAQVEKPKEQGTDVLPWDRPVSKLIIDLGRFALVDDENNLIGEGKVNFESIARMARALKVNPDQVYIDMGGPDVSAILELCKRNGFTPVKGASTGVIKQTEVQGLTAFLIDYKKPPFSFVED